MGATMTTAVLAITLMATTATAGQPAPPPTAGICNRLFGPAAPVRQSSGAASASRAPAIFDVCFDGEVWHTQLPPTARLTNKDPVWIRIRHFNFLRYSLSFDVKEEQAESYAYLTRLWSSVLNPELGALIGTLSEATDGAGRLLNATRIVYRDAQELQRRIDAAMAPHRKPGLTAAEVSQLRTASEGVSTAAQTLDASYRELQRLVESDADVFKAAFASATARYYNLASTTYATASARADSFAALAERSLGDDIEKLGTRNAGTRVTVVLTATEQTGVKDDFETIHYFVQTSMPLVAHGGLAFSGVKDISFEAVKRAAQFSEEDFFQQRGTGGNSRSFAAFLAWQFYAANRSLDADAKQQPMAIMLSMGTDVQSPGSTLFIGPSAMLFGRFVVTAGAALAREEKGEEAIEPNLFRLVQHHGRTTWFSSLTMRVY
jgi:hypothetical protein